MCTYINIYIYIYIYIFSLSLSIYMYIYIHIHRGFSKWGYSHSIRNSTGNVSHDIRELTAFFGTVDKNTGRSGTRTTSSSSPRGPRSEKHYAQPAY